MRNWVRIIVLALLLVVAFSLAVVKGESNHATTQDAACASKVKIDNFSFGPQSISVSAGTTVTWKNRDDIPHTVVSTEGAFESRVMDTGETFCFTFENPAPIRISARSIRR
jgi:plastocyanin